MAVNLSMLAGAGAQFFDNNGIPLAGGLVYTYAAGTTTPQATYTTSAGSIAHANPIVLDSAGRTPSGGEIWLTDAVAYKFVLKTSGASTIGTYDNVTGNASGIYAAFAASSGSSLVGFIQTGTGAVATTAQAKMRQWVSVIDFGADSTGSADSTAAFTAAIATQKVVVVPNGTYKINSPVALEASPAAALTLVGQGGNHTGFSGNGPVVIDLGSNTQYFIALGYSPNISGLTFKDGVDVFHYSSQATDGSICELRNIQAFRFTGTFFKMFGSANGSHITWNNPVLVTSSTSSVVYDDATNFPSGGTDALTINDGWIETASTVAFKTTTGRITINDTRSVPYTNAGSLWFDIYALCHFTAFNSDWGGESARQTIKWRATGGNITFSSCGVYAAGTSVINMIAPPERIKITDLDTSTATTGLLSTDASMTAANQTLLQNTILTINGNTYPTLEYLVNKDSLPTLFGLMPQWLNQVAEGVVKVGDLLAVFGSSWASATGSTNATALVTPTDTLGNSSQVIGWQATSAGSFNAYRYNAGAPGQTTIPVGEATMEAFVCVTGATARVELYFGDRGDGSGAAQARSFYLAPGSHRICFPLFVTSTMTGASMKLGVQCFGQNGSTIMFSRVRVFAGMYHHRCDDIYATTANSAPTSATYPWFIGDRVINAPASAANPVAWTCTASGSPGTWRSEGNL